MALAPVVRDALARIVTETREREAEVTAEDLLPPVMAHRAPLVQVVANLLGNAVKFVGPGVRPRVPSW